MNRFIIKILSFCALLLLYFGITGTVNLLIIRFSNLPIGETHILIMGDSHPEKAFDPALLRSASNLAQSTEPFPVTYWKLRRVLEERKIDTVFIGFAQHNLTAYQDTKFMDQKTAPEMFRRIYPIARFDKMPFLQVDYQTFFTVWLRHMAIIPRSDHFNYLPEYSNSKLSNVGDYKIAADRHFTNNAQPVEFSVTAMTCLDSIISLCREKQVEPVLVACPVHPLYFEQIPEYIQSRYEAEKLRYRQIGVTVIDLTCLVLPDSCYLNADHLNQTGAEKFSRELLFYLQPENQGQSEYSTARLFSLPGLAKTW